MSKAQTQDKRFREAYAKELAKALLENERKQQQHCNGDVTCNAQDVYSNQDIEKAYLSLCYDHPQLENDDGICIQLAHAILGSFHSLKLNKNDDRHNKGPDHGGLIPSRMNLRSTASTGTTNLGLCNRFVQGLLEMATSHNLTVGGTRSNIKSSTRTMDESDYTKPYSGESLMLSDTTDHSTRRTLSLLAFVCFVVGPLYCCQIFRKYLDDSNDLGSDFDESMAKEYCAIQTFLGSYEGKLTQHGNVVSHDDGAHDRMDSSSMTMRYDESTQEKKQKSNDDLIQGTKNDNDDDSMKEIFAAESDPDDYDFGNDRYNDLQSQENVEHELKSFNVSWDAKILCQAKILTLDEMKQRVESLLSDLTPSLIHLGNKEWREWDAGNQLVSLTLELLLLLGKKGFNSLGAKFIKPLTVLRDIAVDSSRSCVGGLDTYLKLIQTLLESEVSMVGDYASKNDIEEGELSPARCLGLSSLADLCSNQNIVMAPSKAGIKAKVKVFVMECVDELVECVAFVRPKDKNLECVDDGSTTLLRVSTMISQILDFMTGIQSSLDCSSMGSHNTVANISASEARGFLQSGLFRELILLYVCIETTQDDSQLVPNTSKLHFMVVQQLLRTILILSSQSEILRSYVARVPEFTNIIYSDDFDHVHVAEAILWHALLANVTSSKKVPQMRMKGVVMVSSSELIKRSKHNFLKLCAKVVDDKSDKVSVVEFLKLCNCCHQIPFVAECWSSVMRSDLVSGDVRAVICDVLKALPQEITEAKMKLEDKDVPSEKLHSVGIHSASTTASVRKGCKHLLSFLEMHEHSSQAVQFSSKID